MRLFDLDVKESFLCTEPQCGLTPKILVCDGTTLSFQRSFIARMEGIDCEPMSDRFKGR
jgi:hypothetical protein